ncbi:hypothetical protein [Xanthomonas phage DES1]|nr:hypothetical protein [Xanthomonas phage DES1]
MLEDYIVAKAPTGSREICNPAPTDTDEDYIVLVEDINGQDLDRALRVEGFYFASGDGYPESEFHSYRKGDLNYILTDNAEFFDRFVAATQLAKKYNLLEKSDRVQMFHAVLEGEFISDEEAQSRAGKKAKVTSRIEGQTFTYIDEIATMAACNITIPAPETFTETVAYANSIEPGIYIPRPFIPF